MVAKSRGERILLVEDGGYLSPVLNRLCLEGKSLREALRYFGLLDEMGGFVMLPVKVQLPDADLDQSLERWLSDLLPGTVEHTRNGYDRLHGIQREFGRLQFPATTIAVSTLKRDMESREVSVSILHAVESILHGLGLVLSCRRSLVLGHRGAIGRNLIADLIARMGASNVLGVDIVVPDGSNGEKGVPGRDAEGERAGVSVPSSDTIFQRIREADSLSGLPEGELLDVDLIIGVVGKSILERGLLERMVSGSRRRDLFFASGSTKTVEFTHLSEWLQEIQMSDAPSIAGRRIHIYREPVRDPQTDLIQGHRVRIKFLDDATVRNLYLLGGLTPINFLYYGVPTEIMDPVLAQLLRLSAGFWKRALAGEAIPCRLLAVDEEIDENAALLRNVSA